MNKKRIGKFIASMMLTSFIIVNIPTNAFAEVAIVKTVTSPIVNGEISATTVTSEVKLYYGTSSNVATNLTELKSQLETSLNRKDATLSLKYTGGDISDWKSTIASSLVEIMNKPGNDYTKFTMKQWQYSYNILGEINFTFAYIETPAQTAFVDTKVSEIISTIITSKMTDEQKEKAVNDYVVSNIAYDTTLVQHSAYAGLVAPYKTVCQGYALLTYKLLIAAGLEARIIEGSAGGPHAWNLVKVNGKWYHLDTTWNDPLPDIQGRIRYDLFNLQDSQISDASRKHTWDKTKYIGYEAYTPYVTLDNDILSKGRANESKAPELNNIIITNNAVIADNIKVLGLKPGDTLKIFSDASPTAKMISSAVVKPGTTEVNIIIPQIGTNSSKLYFSVLSSGYMESPRIPKDFVEEPTTVNPTDAQITVTNTIARDSVIVTGLAIGDTVKVYDKLDTTGKVLGTSKVAAGKTDATVSIAQLGKTEGNIYVTVTSTIKRESSKVTKAFDAEPVSIKSVVANITTTNNAIIADTVKVTGLTVGDIVKVYDKLDSTKKVLGTGTVLAGKTEVIINIAKLPLDFGNVYVSVTSPKKLESDLVESTYEKEQTTVNPTDAQITVTNTISADSVIVTGLAVGDTVKVYDKSDITGKVLGTSKVAAGKTDATVSISQLGKTAGNIYITVTSTAKRESLKVTKAFDIEK